MMGASKKIGRNVSGEGGAAGERALDPKIAIFKDPPFLNQVEFEHAIFESSSSGHSNRCLTYYAPRLYNKLSENIKSTQTVAIFKSRLKTFLFTQVYDMNDKCISMDYRT